MSGDRTNGAHRCLCLVQRTIGRSTGALDPAVRRQMRFDLAIEPASILIVCRRIGCGLCKVPGVKKNNPAKILGDTIRGLREAEGISQEALADRCGLHRTYVGSVERGERNVSLVNIVRLAKALGQAPAVLLLGLG